MKKKLKKKRQKSAQHINTMFVSEYEITDEPLEEPSIKRLPLKVQNEVLTKIEELHELLYRNPKETIPQLEKLIEQFPTVPQFYNFLCAAYQKSGEEQKAESIGIENYKKHPHYLFARLNYAEICIRKGELDKIPEIFNDKFDLKMLYPNRRRFHISEVVQFMGTIGFYFCKIGVRQAAEVCYQALNQLAPKHPMTKRLKRTLNPPLLIRLLEKLVNKTEPNVDSDIQE